MGNFKTIRAAIVKAIEDNSEKVEAVYNYECSTFSGFPSVVVAPSENQADYGSTQRDKLLFVFKVRIYYPIAKETDHAAAETALEEVVDELLGIFRDRESLGSSCDWLEPVLGTWYYEERGEGVYRVAELTLRCVKYIG